MSKFEAHYIGHSRNARKAVIQMGLAKENELALMSDEEVAKLINESDYFIFVDESKEGYALVPKKLQKEIIWISR